MKNAFRQTGKSLSQQDLEDVEHALGVRIPEEVKSHYLEYNGGMPERDLWMPEPDEGNIWIKSFISMKHPYSTRIDDTVEYMYRVGIQDDYLIEGLIPFAIDHGGNFICFNERGEVYFCAMDFWDKKLSNEQNKRAMLRVVTDSFAKFVDQLVLYETAEWGIAP